MNRHHPSSRGAILALSLVAALATAAHAATRPGVDSDNAVSIESPLSATFGGADVPLTLRLGANVAGGTLAVHLNGHAIDADRLAPAADARGCDREPRAATPGRRGQPQQGVPATAGCTNETHELVARLAPNDGLKSGQNNLRVTAYNEDGSVDAETVDFGYVPPVTGIADSSSIRYTPKSIGITVTPGGATPWVRLTTGWPTPAAADPDTHALPSYDATFPSTTDTACTSSDVYQVLVLDRTAPTNEIAYACFGDGASLATYLATRHNDELVLVGTTWGNNATSDLDTSNVGGTSYTKANTAAQPRGYLAIGVPGATAGTAYESYYVDSDTNVPAGSVDPQAIGTLNFDVNSNYSFVAGGNIAFTVTPNDPTQGGTFSTMAIGTNQYDSISIGTETNAGGFWLLVLDRLTLHSVTTSADIADYCRSDLPLPKLCGSYFATGAGGTNPEAATQALTTALNAVTDRQIVILTTQGQAIVRSSQIDAGLATAISRLGGTYYTMQRLSAPSRNYTLVATGPDPAVMSKNGNKISPFAQGVFESTNLFTQQQQSGVLHGLFARDTNGLYYAMLAAQQSTNATEMAAPVEYSFHVLSTAPTGDWPMTDTAAHLAAYHYISNQYLGAYPLSMTGAYAYDLRYHYPSLTDAVESNASWFVGSCPSVSTTSFTMTEYCDVWTQLKAEIGALHSVRATFGDGGLRGTFTSQIAPDAIDASYTVADGQFAQTPSGNVNMNVANWLKLGSGICSLAAATIPGVGPMFGVAAAVLNIGSTASAMKAKPTDPPQFESKYDVSLANADAYAKAFTTNLPIAYDTSLNMIYSDWTKLGFVGAKIDDTSSGWQFSGAVKEDAFSDAISIGASRALYLQLVPQYYEIDANMSTPVRSIAAVASINDKDEKCDSNYPSAMSIENYLATNSVGASEITPATDFLVLAGAIDDNQTWSMKESLPSQKLLDALFADPNGATTGFLNLPPDMIFSNSSYLTYRPSTAMWTATRCWKPGCTWDLKSGWSVCVGP